MTKQEFQKRIGTEISQKDYSIVEHVYTWHPSISEVEGKEQIAELYKSFGMPIIKNMMEAANYAETLDRAMAQAQRQVEELRKRIIRVNALEYSEQVNHKGKKETVRHTICISDGCLEEIAEYQTKERCLQVLKDFCGAYENECYTVEFFDTAAQATRPAMYKKNIVYEFPAE